MAAKIKEIIGIGCLSCREYDNCTDREKKCGNYKPMCIEVRED